jgi:hypothetical protein
MKHTDIPTPTAILDLPLLLDCSPATSVLGKILSQCCQHSNWQLLSYVLTSILAKRREQLGDYDPLPSSPSWLTQRNEATRYPTPIVRVYCGKKVALHASWWCHDCGDYVVQGHAKEITPDIWEEQPCPAVDLTDPHRYPSYVEACCPLRNGEINPEKVRLSYVEEFWREKRIRARRLYYLAQSNAGISYVKDPAKRAEVWSLSVEDDPINVKPNAAMRMGATHQNKLENGGKRVNTLGGGGDGGSGGGSDYEHSSRDVRNKLLRRDNHYKTILHCAHCGRRFAGRVGAVCCTFDCEFDYRNKKKTKGVRNDKYKAVSA